MILRQGTVEHLNEALASCFRHAGLELRSTDLADPPAAFKRAAAHRLRYGGAVRSHPMTTTTGGGSLRAALDAWDRDGFRHAEHLLADDGGATAQKILRLQADGYENQAYGTLLASVGE